MSNPTTPSCPEHDAIAHLIRRTAAALGSQSSIDSRIDILFEALAAVDGVRYGLSAAGEATALTVWVFDRWTGSYAPGATPFTATDGIATAADRAQADATERNRVNVAARAQDLHDELDGRTR